MSFPVLLSSRNKKAQFVVLAQYTYSKEEEEENKPAAKKPKNKTGEKNIEDPKEKDSKFHIIKHH
jgi:hypothetical protein